MPEIMVIDDDVYINSMLKEALSGEGYDGSIRGTVLRLKNDEVNGGLYRPPILVSLF